MTNKKEGEKDFSIKTLNPRKCPWCLEEEFKFGNRMAYPHKKDCVMSASPTTKLTN